ncbi:UNVERIFIED_CONTAM: putative GEM-like protein 8 [Sesamum calycinum]|uniref:GEM-like protein 8 n=1 Tax=Sesamum calycinum TaxID=2727403 RepID=A0AAW2PN44_9LAMI
MEKQKLKEYESYNDDGFGDHFSTTPSIKTPSPSHSHLSRNGEAATPTNHKKLDRKGSSFAYRLQEHVRLGPKFSETVKGKLSIGAKIIKKGGRGNMLREMFGVSEGEKLLKASQCYLSTTAGPMPGILFISTQKLAFCSERPITLRSSSGESLIKTPYKVSIPMKKIESAYESENVKNPGHKYIEIVTKDQFEFWFMGFCEI